MSAFSTARLRMVDGQVRPSDVTDLRTIDAMLDVPREAFVPENRISARWLISISIWMSVRQDRPSAFS
jgi:protein-L-isoaspartate(D-aspartate) O-methyltransferase